MTISSISSRLTANHDRRLLTDLIRRQGLVEGNKKVAQSFATKCKVLSFPANTVVISQGTAGNDLYLILSGRVRIFVNDREVAFRGSGQHVGEMALVDAALKRTATVVSIERTVVAKISESVFVRIANSNPFLWRNVAIELVRRLDERRKFHRAPNPKAVLFVGSSKEGLPIAKALAAGIPGKVSSVKLWSNKGIFGPSRFPIEDLSVLLQSADFAALVASADDTVTVRGKKSQAPRDNIVFELGLFMGTLSRQRTFLLVPCGVDIKIPTDLFGINTLRYDPNAPTPSAAVASSAEEITDIIRNAGPR